MIEHTDTIVAQGHPSGPVAASAIIRVSGPKAKEVALAVAGRELKPRYAEYLPFKNEDGKRTGSGHRFVL